MTFYIHCDGSCYNHPDYNTTGYAAVLSNIKNPKMVDVIKTKTGWQREGTNNTAEWLALLAGMRLMMEHDIGRDDRYIIITDSQLVAGQASGRWRVINNGLKYYYAEYRALEKDAIGMDFDIQWTPRCFNKAADMYSKLANPYFKDKITNELQGIQAAGDGEEDNRTFPPHIIRDN